MRFQLALTENFCLSSRPLTMKAQPKEQKNKKKKMLPASPSLAFHTNSTICEANKFPIVTVTDLRPPLPKSLIRMTNIYASIASEHNFRNTGIEYWLSK